MTKEEVIDGLKRIIKRQQSMDTDISNDHALAICFLLDYIGDPEIEELVLKIKKPY